MVYDMEYEDMNESEGTDWIHAIMMALIYVVAPLALWALILWLVL